LKPPHGLAEIKALFGDPRRFYVDGGLDVSGDWPGGILCSLPLPAPLPLSWELTRLVSRIRCHSILSPILGRVLAEIHDAGLWPGLRDFGGCYQWRLQRGGSKLSTHSWGIALDFRVSTCQLGTPGDMPQAIVEAFEGAGFQWGGRWLRPDPQHFQFAEGY
jgi:hypothetical protein